MKAGKAMLDWAVATFGTLATKRQERAMRFLEEAMELAQAERVGPDTANIILERVYSRPAGSVAEEVGQAQMTLALLAANIGLDAEAEGEREFLRVKTIPQEEWDRRHNAKVALGMASQRG